MSLDQDLEKLRAAIDGLPPSCHSGRRDGPLAEYLMPKLSSTTEENPQLVFPTSSDGPYSTFIKQWERVFQKKPTDPSDKLQRPMCRGKHGLILAYSWAAHYATVVGPDERDLVLMRVQQLLRIITDEVPVVGVASSSKTGEDGSRTDEGEGDSDGGDNGDDDQHNLFNGEKAEEDYPKQSQQKGQDGLNLNTEAEVTTQDGDSQPAVQVYCRVETQAEGAAEAKGKEDRGQGKGTEKKCMDVANQYTKGFKRYVDDAGA
ncbi:hypothetical protein B0H16DRAFT_1837813 [Mycena metata]|uniref:Uncharacterized protein n=1 Tax=Mycena metata TaxID=1033252 RepID=A0AAD7GMP5_9AGAR|nr:hypothetical protein B0H16DRAFT_1837813 [Mycena metata]